ncbi:hypothetical protein EQG49_12615 [Periweissella cryptocerci]|uniref:Uncharacterized protein n=1 Tax=Periweissella cryptocerci TaxID=2506420 RepID=A0A4P6YWM3_9LACO|nr:hypothetical protein [Periweissella cryptocerci]QBO37240.1 hypothetical protein EQG49_12615 [Periweissella cryptocerci]
MKSKMFDIVASYVGAIFVLFTPLYFAVSFILTEFEFAPISKLIIALIADAIIVATTIRFYYK